MSFFKLSDLFYRCSEAVFAGATVDVHDQVQGRECRARSCTSLGVARLLSMRKFMKAAGTAWKSSLPFPTMNPGMSACLRSRFTERAGCDATNNRERRKGSESCYIRGDPGQDELMAVSSPPRRQKGDSDRVG